VSYPVDITLTQTASGLKPGMSATAVIVTGQASGLVVPTQALRGSTVNVMRNAKATSQQVQTGVTGDTSTQIVSGLSDGDQVVITSTTAAAANAAGGAAGAGARAGGLGGGGLGGGGFGAGGGGFGGGGGFRGGGGGGGAGGARAGGG
jgi:hypothetical protein